ncbi:MAG TPA: hypothetical protein VIY72_16835 [Acidimicrobiales bacterium]
MGDDVDGGADPWTDSFVGRAVLTDSPEGRAIASDFIGVFGSFVSDQVRPVLRRVADEGGEPQLLMNGLAELLRSVADSIESPPGTRGDRSIHPTPDDPYDPDDPTGSDRATH